MKFRADRARTLRKFFMKIGRKHADPMADMRITFLGNEENPACNSVGCVGGWTCVLFPGNREFNEKFIDFDYACEALGVKHGEDGLRLGPWVNPDEVQLFSTRGTELPGWKEALDRLTKLLQDRGCKLRGKEAPRKQIAGLDY